jgi:hypothetical protein
MEKTFIAASDFIDDDFPGVVSLTVLEEWRGSLAP